MAQTTTSGKPSIGTVIRAWRLFQGFTPKELAARAGVRPGYLSEVENDKKVNPWLSKLKQLADALEIPLSYIEDRRMPRAGASALGSGVGLSAILSRSSTGQEQTETPQQRNEQSIRFLAKLEQTIDEFQLTPEKRILAEQLLLENARTVCGVLAKGQDMQGR